MKNPVQTQFSTYFVKIVGSDNVQVNDPLRIFTVSAPAEKASEVPKGANQVSVKRGEKATITLASEKPGNTVFWFKERHEIYVDEFASPLWSQF